MNIWMVINIHTKLQTNPPVVGGDISKTKTLTKTLTKVAKSLTLRVKATWRCLLFFASHSIYPISMHG